MDGGNDGSGDPGGVERKETEEEYDARLEREENERIAAEKRRRLEVLRDRHQRDLEKPPQNGVRFKGMRWLPFFRFESIETDSSAGPSRTCITLRSRQDEVR